MSDEKPWEDYAEPVASGPSQASGGVDWEDVGKGAVGGLGRGTTGLIGAGGTIGELTRAGLTKLGVPKEAIDTAAAGIRYTPIGALVTGPSGADLQRKAEEYTGKFYEPKTVAGQYASTIGEFAPSATVGPGGWAAKAVNTVVPAVASETAGQLTKGTPYEAPARGATAIISGITGAKILTPTAPPTAARRAAVDVLEREGIPLTAGERTGSNAIKWLESTAADMPASSGAAQAQKQAQNTAINRVVTESMFDPAELARRGVPADAQLPQQAVMHHGRQSLQDEYTRLSNANVLRSDPQLLQDLQNARTTYERRALPSQRPGGVRDINAIYDDIVDNLVAGQGTMPGDVYQATRSRMGTLAKGVPNDSYLAAALRDTRGALDRAMHRGLSPEDSAAWALNNQRYANMRQLEGVVARSGENMTPAAIAQGVRSGRAGQYASGRGNLDEFAKAVSDVVKPLPNSGTAQRTAWQQMWGMPGALTAGGGVLGTAFGLLGTGIGLAAPHIAARAALSRPGQAYLANQVAPQNTRELIAQLLAQQAATQPSSILRSQANQAEVERKRRQDLRDAGL
jgi:hypothetical protein